MKARWKLRLTLGLTRARGFASSWSKKMQLSSNEATQESIQTAEDFNSYAAEYNSEPTDGLTGDESPEKSRLFSSPAEIRNQIYENVLVESEPIEISSSNTPAEPGLLAVNQQVRKEARKLYYAQNTFNIVLVDYDVRNSSH